VEQVLPGEQGKWSKKCIHMRVNVKVITFKELFTCQNKINGLLTKMGSWCGEKSRDREVS
jgi:hypothetical protein